MKSRFIFLGVGLLSLACSDQSLACRIMRSPAAKIALGGFNAVVIGRVKEARYAGEVKADDRPWNGTVRLETVVRGHVSQNTFPIARSGSATACDDGEPVPTEGQAWVLYLGGQDPALFVIHSFPLSIACLADPALPEVVCRGLSRGNSNE